VSHLTSQITHSHPPKSFIALAHQQTHQSSSKAIRFRNSNQFSPIPLVCIPKSTNPSPTHHTTPTSTTMPPHRDHPFLPTLRARLRAIRENPSAILTALGRHLRLGQRDPVTAERPYTRRAFGNADRAAEYEATIARVLAARRGPVDLSRVQSWDFEGPSTEPSTASSGTASSSTEEEEENGENGEEVVLQQDTSDSYVPSGAGPEERRDSYRGYHSTNSARMRRERLRMLAERMGGGETMSERSTPGFASSSSSSSSSTSALENGAGTSSAAASASDSPSASPSQTSERQDPARQPNIHVPASLAHIFAPPPTHPATPGSSSGDSGVDVRPGRYRTSPPGPRIPATGSPSTEIPQALQHLPVRAAPSPPAPGRFKLKSKATAPRRSSSCPTPSSSDSESGVQNPPGPAHPLRRKNRCSLRARFRLGTPEPLETAASAPPAPTAAQHAPPPAVQSTNASRDEARSAHASLAQRLRAARLEDLHGMTPALHAEISGLLSELRQSRETGYATLPRRSARGSARLQNTVDAGVREHWGADPERGDAARTLPRGYRVPGGEGRRGRGGEGMLEGEGRREEERGRSRVRRGSEGALGARREGASGHSGVSVAPQPSSSPHIRFASNLPVPIRPPSYRSSTPRRRPPSPYPGVYPGARRACAATSAGPPAPSSAAHTNVPVPRRARANRTSRRRGRAPSPYPGARRRFGSGDGGEWENLWGDEDEDEDDGDGDDV
ncbi:hypothetical protein IQ07DRAFT_662520, partial [Pyrenochaeta sp. DS3sAY3a]